MKNKLILFILVILTMFVLTGCSGSGEVVYVYNWADFIDQENIAEFTKETGIKVVYDTFPSNEDLYAKLKQGGTKYDVIVPSEYMVERMINEGMLREIDLSKIPSYGTIDDEFKNLPYDPGNKYSVPYLWGTVGIIYNTDEITEEITSWADLWNSKYEGQIIMYNSQRDLVMAALKKNGFSMNTRNPEELEKAKQDLIDQKSLVYAYLADSGRDEIIAGNANIYFAYSGDALMMMDEVDNLKYVIPKEGTNIWYDNWAIPANAENVENAYKFIEFMTKPEHAYRNAEYNYGEALPSTEARMLLSDYYKNNPISYPSEELLKNSEVYDDVLDIADIYDNIWTEIQVSE